MSILDKLKEQTGKNAATTISDTLPLESGGGGLVALTATLPMIDSDDPSTLYATYDDLFNGIKDRKIFYFYRGKTLNILFQTSRALGKNNEVKYCAYFISFDPDAEATGSIRIRTFYSTVKNEYLIEM